MNSKLKATLIGLVGALTIGGVVATTVVAERPSAVAAVAGKPTAVKPNEGKPAGGGPGGMLDHFSQKLAAKLSLDEQTVRRAVIDARKEMLEVALAAGWIPPERAERIRQHLEQAGGGPHPGKLGVNTHRGGILGAAASVLGLTHEELTQKIGEGKTLPDIVRALGRDPVEVRNEIVAGVQSQINAVVQAGRLHPGIAAQLKAQLPNRVDRLMNLKPAGPRKGQGQAS